MAFPEYSPDYQTDLLLHLDNSLTDNSPNNISVTNSGGTFSTTHKVGTHSIYFDGTSNKYLEMTTTDLDFGTNDFTIEWWWYRTAIQARRNGIIEIGNANNLDSLLIRTDSDGHDMELFVNNAYTFDYSYTWATGQWYHVAVVRNHGYTTLYIDGDQKVTPVSDSDNINPASSTVRIGAMVHTVNQYAEGYIDEFRVSNGLARYFRNFTPDGGIRKKHKRIL